jgi:hypothetical protein
MCTELVTVCQSTTTVKSNKDMSEYYTGDIEAAPDDSSQVCLPDTGSRAANRYGGILGTMSRYDDARGYSNTTV